MKTFLTEDFLLKSKPARSLYHEVASELPIYDYHCHLPPAQIASDHRFRNLYEVWLGGDHYKWRAMRANGVPERFCTGDAEDREKFLAFAKTVPMTLRNPLYHWTHLELLRYFGIDDLLDGSTAEGIWARANEMLGDPAFSTRGLLRKSRVAVVCTTDDPTDDLEPHRAIREARDLETRVYPAFRPDKALAVREPALFDAWVAKLEAASGVDCSTFSGFLDALENRHSFFHAEGCRLSDHGMNFVYCEPCSAEHAAVIYDRARRGMAAGQGEQERFGAFLMLFFGRLDASRGWVKQLHLGALRNANFRALCDLGPDTGFDSIGDWRHAERLAAYLGQLAAEGSLPKTILYNLNPADNYVFASMIGNYQDGSVPGKMQFGSGWWFLDQKEGMTWQLNALSSLGLLSRFVGMLTDSRSFLSYPRHEYFRRILCNLIGSEVDSGELPADFELLAAIVRGVCFENAKAYFGLEPGRLTTS